MWPLIMGRGALGKEEIMIAEHTKVNRDTRIEHLLHLTKERRFLQKVNRPSWIQNSVSKVLTLGHWVASAT